MTDHDQHDRRQRVVVLSRQGRASLTREHARALAQVADVRYRGVRERPGPGQARALLGDADLLAATNGCLPELDADLLDALPRLRGVVL